MINCYIHYLWFGIITFLTYEVLAWAIVLNKHSIWLNEADKLEKRTCFKGCWIRLFMASVMASGMSLAVFFWEVYFIYNVYTHRIPHGTYLPLFVAIVQLNTIHFFAIIARCSCLHRTDWPRISRKISRFWEKFS